MSLKIYPYIIGSESAQKLADLLNVLQVKPNGNYVPQRGQCIINWGSSRQPDWAVKAMNRDVTILNKPAAVNIAANKLNTLQALSSAGVSIPKFTTDIHQAGIWLTTGHTVVERHELRGNSGDGVRIVNRHDEDMESNLTHAPLYTRYINKTCEFRVHVFKGQVIDYIEKKKVSSDRRGDNFNKYICSIDLGWVFSRTNVRDIPEVRTLAIRAVAALGLDFGAVDIVYADGQAYVLEVNTAPGILGTTLVNYANAFLRYTGKPDLSSSITGSILDPIERIVPAARPSIPIDNSQHEMVTLRIDRATANKLKQLLAHI